MAADSGHGVVDDNVLNTRTEEEPVDDELARLKKDLELLKNANPFRVVEMALEIQIERMRLVEIVTARDAAVQRLSDAYVSIRQKQDIIDRLQKEREDKYAPRFTPNSLLRVPTEQADILALKAHIHTLETIVEELKAAAKENTVQPVKPSDPPPNYEETAKPNVMNAAAQVDTKGVSPVRDQLTSREASKVSESDKLNGDAKVPHPPKPEELVEFVKARNRILASIPLPPNPPDNPLVPISLPSSMTLHDFLSSASATLRTCLGNYRVLQSVTTNWCPEREEHGFMYTPVFKCSTNPRVATAHRWNAVDVIGRMSKPTECFYNNEGTWYYAGSYKAFQMDDVTTREWAELSTETSSALIKDTIAGRKNSSPQNTYETSQLYAAGALKVACVGLQCVGFNQEVYRSVTELAAKLNQSKWKALGIPTPPAATTPVQNQSLGLPVPVTIPTSHFKPPPPATTTSPSLHSGTGSPISGLGIGAPAWNAGLVNGVLLPLPAGRENSPFSGDNGLYANANGSLKR